MEVEPLHLPSIIEEVSSKRGPPPHVHQKALIPQSRPSRFQLYHQNIPFVDPAAWYVQSIQVCQQGLGEPYLPVPCYRIYANYGDSADHLQFLNDTQFFGGIIP